MRRVVFNNNSKLRRKRIAFNLVGRARNRLQVRPTFLTLFCLPNPCRPIGIEFIVFCDPAQREQERIATLKAIVW